VNPEKEWRELCAEFEAAGEALNKAWRPVLAKQTAISRGAGSENATPEQDARLDTAIDNWNDAKEQMQEFMKAHRARR
jgi:hypothetical protein